MEGSAGEKASVSVGQLVRALAKTYHWTGLYGANHPTLAKRVGELHAALLVRLAEEPEGRLYLGIARTKVLYRDQFLGEGQDLVSRLTESLYLRQVATVAFDASVTPGDLLGLFRYLHAAPENETPIPPEQFLRENGIRGISLLPYNYKEVLSRRIAGPGDAGRAEENREEALWRLLLDADPADRGLEEKMMDDLLHAPTLLQAVLRRAQETTGERASAGDPQIPGDVVRKVVDRVSSFVCALPDERKRQVLAAIHAGLGADEPGSGPANEAGDLLIAHTLADGESDSGFLGLLAGILALEGKGGDRLRRSFAIVAGERNEGNALGSQVAERVRESRRAKDYYAERTWEAVERLILSRGEDRYIQTDHLRFLEEIAAKQKPAAAQGAQADELGIAPAFDKQELRRHTCGILVEILKIETREDDFLDILEDFRTTIPNLVSRRDFAAVHAVLLGLESVAAATRPEWRDAVREIIATTDFGHVADLYLSGDATPDEAGRMKDLLTAFGAAAAPSVLDRLLIEPEASRRRSLIRLLGEMGKVVVPETVNRMAHAKWYFVRNLCTVLGDVGDRSAAGPLMRAVSHADYRVKREAILAIGKLAPPEAVPPLGRILTEEGFFSTRKDDQVRIAAADALYRIGGSEAIAFLSLGRNARRRAVRTHCDELLRSVTEGP